MKIFIYEILKIKWSASTNSYDALGMVDYFPSQVIIASVFQRQETFQGKGIWEF